MTEFQALIRAIEARGKAAAKEARARAAAALIVAASEVPGVTAQAGEDTVVLSGRALKGRAYGTRRTLPDARVQSVVRPGGFL